MHENFQPYAYIMASKKNGTLYTGVTSDLVKRVWQHRVGEVPGFTARYRVKHLVHYEPFGTMELAIAREKQLKRWHRQWKINLIEQDNAGWSDLGGEIGLPGLDAETRSA